MMIRLGGFAQGISLSEKKAPLEHLFKSIQKQSGYHFFYTDELMRTSSPVSVLLKNVTLEKALENIFSGQPFQNTILERTIAVKAKRASPQLALPAPTATESLAEGEKPGEINTLGRPEKDDVPVWEVSRYQFTLTDEERRPCGLLSAVPLR